MRHQLSSQKPVKRVRLLFLLKRRLRRHGNTFDRVVKSKFQGQTAAEAAKASHVGQPVTRNTELRVPSDKHGLDNYGKLDASEHLLR